MISKITNLIRAILIRKYRYRPGMFDYLEKATFQESNIKNDLIRLNIIIPNIDKRKMYGGQRTALTFFLKLMEQMNVPGRILVDSPVEKEMVTEQYPDWKLVEASQDYSENRLIVPYDMKSRKGSSLSVRKRDIFITTFWTGHYIIQKTPDFQFKVFSVINPIIYFIQDFEPGFYKWSTEYFLVDSTYHTENTIAVFNSHQLSNYFSQMGYEFADTCVFEPKLTTEIYQCLHYLQETERKRQVVFYGRPYNDRNCFSLIVESINEFITRHPGISKKWEFISIGSTIKKIRLADGRILKSYGKMSLDTYAKVLAESKIGVSLMCSPHPSYPPMEMATFGVITITNSFVCKDLSEFSDNIISLKKVTFETISDAIYHAILMRDRETTRVKTVRSSYLLLSDPFDNCLEYVSKSLYKHMNKN